MSINNRNTIYNALPIVAAAYGEKFGVKVKIGNDMAHTDGKTIVVPNVPADYPNMDVVWGYLAHEAAHVRWTDFSAPRRPGLHAELTNVFEDCRIEREMMALYPGTTKTLNDVASYMAQAGHYTHLTDNAHPAQIIIGYSLYWLQARAVGQGAINPFLESSQAVLQRVMPKGMVTRLNVLLRKVVDTKSTQEVCALADEVIRMIEDEQQKAANKQKQEDKSSPEHDDGQEDPQDQNGSSDGDGQEDESGKGEAQSSSGSDHAQVLSQVLNAGAADVDSDNARKALKAELGAVAAEKGDASYQTVRQSVSASEDLTFGLALMARVRSSTTKIRTQLLGLVQASLRCSTRTAHAGKRVDVTKLHRVVSGNTRVFVKPLEKRKPNTAVHILDDRSGSMARPTGGAGESRSRADVSQEACLALALALDAIPNVNPAVTFFCANEEHPVVSAVKHGQQVGLHAGKFGFKPNGGTPMAEAIWYAAFELSKTREDRKMLIVLTDGEPNNMDSTQAVINLCEKSGIEVIGIGIETNAPAQLFKKNICIADVADLQKTLFKLMEKSLTASS